MKIMIIRTKIRFHRSYLRCRVFQCFIEQRGLEKETDRLEGRGARDGMYITDLQLLCRAPRTALSPRVFRSAFAAGTEGRGLVNSSLTLAERHANKAGNCGAGKQGTPW